LKSSLEVTWVLEVLKSGFVSYFIGLNWSTIDKSCYWHWILMIHSLWYWFELTSSKLQSLQRVLQRFDLRFWMKLMDEKCLDGYLSWLLNSWKYGIERKVRTRLWYNGEGILNTVVDALLLWILTWSLFVPSWAKFLNCFVHICYWWITNAGYL
jgi:hypothetical protein